MTDELDKPIGTKDAAKLSAGSVTVQRVTVEPAKEGSKAKIVRFYCKHPESPNEIVLSNIKIKKIQGNNETIKKDALWYNLDDDGNIRKTSNVAEVMRFYNKQTLKQFEGSVIKTELDTTGYLVIKSY